MIMIMIAQLFTGGYDDMKGMIWLASASALLSFVVGFLLYQLAILAETFDYDVVRTLNTPRVLQHAKRHFGDLFLVHVESLQWGFRSCGKVITMSFATNIAAALML